MINSSTAYFVMCLAVITFFIPWKYFLLPYILAACFIPQDQRIIIMDLDFTVFRILVVVGVLRLLVRGGARSIRWNRFDLLVLLWVFTGAIIYVIQWHDMRALIYKCGVLFDVIGLYWLARQYVRTWDEVGVIAQILAVSALISALLILVELKTEHNPFTFFGNVATGMHRGRYRCRGSFSHPIILGLFWTNLIPIFIGYAIANRAKMWFWLAAVAACVIILFASGSSTPLATFLFIILFLPVFYYRHYGRQILLGLFGIFLALHAVMAKPVWHLIGRMRLIPGSTGHHRYRLIQAAIDHFGEWAMLGTRDTESWGWGLRDLTNQYIREGIKGGLVTLLIFIIVLVMAVRTFCRHSVLAITRKEQWLGWCFCVSMLGHCVSFFGVSYFGKMFFILYLTFAIVGKLNEGQTHSITSTLRPIICNQQSHLHKSLNH